MRRRSNSTLCRLLMALSVAAGVCGAVRAAELGPSAHPRTPDSAGRQAEWQRVNPAGEEFSMLAPAPPTLIRLGGGYLLPETYERVKEHRSYGGHDGGAFVYFIESYKAERPQNILSVLEKSSYPRGVFEGEAQIGGLRGRRYRLDSASFYGNHFSVVTKEHAYLITVASKEEKSAAIERFISSLVFGDKSTAGATGRAVDVTDMPEYRSAVSGVPDPSGGAGTVLMPRQVTSKAIIVARPEPMYTDEARGNGVTGTVVLRGVFGADGQVRALRVVSGLPDGLTGKAIEAALCIRFFPAEKDGQPVSQYVQIEYNFNLY